MLFDRLSLCRGHSGRFLDKVVSKFQREQDTLKHHSCLQSCRNVRRRTQKRVRAVEEIIKLAENRQEITQS